ncbi:MAG: hypothetical protein AAF628_15105 [Planctomycetota bacterium]
MNHSRTLLFLSGLLVAACAASSGPNSSGGEGGSDRPLQLQRARDLLAADQAHEALAVTDDLLDREPNDVEARLLAADGNMVLFATATSGQEMFLIDAIRNLERALREDARPDRWLQLSDLYLKNSEFGKGKDAALTAARLWREAEAGEAQVAQAVLKAADHELQLFTDLRRSELEAQEDITDGTRQQAEAVLARLEFAKNGAAGPAHRKAAVVYQWLGQYTNALAELERGILADPGEASVHQEYQRLHFDLDRRRECVAAYRRLRDEAEGTPLLTWFLGRAQVALADDQRAKAQLDVAMDTYAEAAESYGQYGAMQPQHAADAKWWIARCHLSRGRCAIDAGDLENARADLDRAYEVDARVAELDENGYAKIYDPFGANYLGGLTMIGLSITEAKSEAALTEGLAYYEPLLDRHEGRFGVLYNNAALAARDLGEAVAAQANDQSISDVDRQDVLRRAMALWEKSYAYYEKAVELEPDDPRIVNDCGLMLVYYLHRDYDRATELFDRTIELARPRLEALADDADSSEREFIEEALGDAYQNTAIMLRQQGRDFADYQGHLEQAIKYFPYRRREAAVLLASKGERGRSTTAGTAVAPAVARPPQDPAKDAAFSRAKEQAEAKAKNDDFDGALLVLDGVAKDLKGHAPYHALVGSYSRQYALQAMQNGGTTGQIDGLLADAVGQLQRAVELDSGLIGPRLELAQVQADQGNFEAASTEADELLDFLASVGGHDDVVAATQAVRATAATRVYTTKKAADEDDPDALRRARSSFEDLERRGSLTDQQLQLWSTLEQWAGAKDRAVGVWARALQSRPDAQATLEKLVETAALVGASEQALAALQDRKDAIGVWFRGRAGFNLSSQQWAAGEIDAALGVLDAAAADFETAKAANAEYAPSSDQWRAFCFGQKGIVLVGAERTDEALEALLAAAQAAPDQGAANLGNGYTIKSGLQVVADRAFRGGDLAKTESVYRAATAALPQDSDLANNHGLMARDLGVRMETDGNEAAATEMFEASYASYTRAAELEPTSVRLLNDRALLLIYHLKRDWDLSLKLLQDAIALGDEIVRDDPPSDDDAKQNLDEAIGDAWENVGVWQERHGDDLAAAREAFQRSVTHYPFERRQSTGHLRRVQRKLRRAQRAAEEGAGESQSEGAGASAGGEASGENGAGGEGGPK